jgi:ketosteroid isomerase-like protein
MSTNQVIRSYFAAIHKGGWESYIAEDFVFISSNLDKIARGKSAYVEGAGRFFRVTTAVEISQLIIDGDNACAVARYQLRSPQGNTAVCDVAEILSVKNGQLKSSTIFFDTKALQDFLAKG